MLVTAKGTEYVSNALKTYSETLINQNLLHQRAIDALLLD